MFLERQEQADWDDCGYHGACINIGPLYRTFSAELADRNLDCADVLGACDEQRPHIRIPLVHEDHESCRNKHGKGDRNNDLGEDLGPFGSVYSCSFYQAWGNVLEELDKKESNQSVGNGGYDHSGVCIHHSEVACHTV